MHVFYIFCILFPLTFIYLVLSLIHSSLDKRVLTVMVMTGDDHAAAAAADDDDDDDGDSRQSVFLLVLRFSSVKINM